DAWKRFVREAAIWAGNKGKPMLLGQFSCHSPSHRVGTPRPYDEAKAGTIVQQAVQFLKMEPNVAGSVYWKYTPDSEKAFNDANSSICYPLTDKEGRLTPIGKIFPR